MGRVAMPKNDVASALPITLVAELFERPNHLAGREAEMLGSLLKRRRRPALR